ncbi:hypothetical protein OG2516_05048 [Oceanicola granulosus HTCC2516]|uniref:Uncharacterized protein n=1 Tax=Oceanicola granulosus (strain ATCC BAA-861 / DSM 15982 / KCTC 12143 / HTCC2516) TaxID=314256 RepID=Q2CBX8_OCEGH|nr:PhnD/SsuA/transferrin family substrate-binding protein [Oceanicola granulosus]EAR50216.1 hypothetical protein OG2516_05048 [Oceanicola granulosus HTCC2516]
MTAEPRAALPMYARPETAEAEARLWALMRAALPDLPARLGTPDDLVAHWRAPDLVLSQTCGLPYRTLLHDRVQLVGTPDYALPDCPPGHYRSVLVMRPDAATRDPEAWARARFATNSRGSHSGWAAPVTHLATHGLAFADVLETGGHVASLRAVARGDAALAAIDAQSWRLARRWEPAAAGLVEVGRTAPTPGLPLITGPAGDAAALAAAYAAAVGDLGAAARERLGLAGLVAIPAEAYLAVPTPESVRASEV